MVSNVLENVRVPLTFASVCSVSGEPELAPIASFSGHSGFALALSSHEVTLLALRSLPAVAILAALTGVEVPGIWLIINQVGKVER